MPYSFTQIEEDKSRVITGVFIFLIFFYFMTFWMIALLIKPFLLYQIHDGEYLGSFWLSWQESAGVLLTAWVIGAFHWHASTHNLIPKILGVLKSEQLKPNDSYHRMFRNILDEVSIATGGKKMEGVVIPTSALNAFAVADFSGKSVIGVTEGLLARLNRAQLEAVIGHEAAHIVSGDCLSTTVITSLSELYSGMLKGIEVILRSGRSSGSRRGSGQGMALLLIIYLLLWCSHGISYLFRMFISRQREYRADAISVRLTRNPLALAEALYAIAFHWRGSGLTAEQLEAIFIINPLYQAFEERENFFAEFFGTHPPVEKRIDVLLNMAHTNMESLIQGFKTGIKNVRSVTPTPVASAAQQWLIHHEGNWQGPFDLNQLMNFSWIKSETWIRSVNSEQIQMAYQLPQVASLFQKSSMTDSPRCPRCQINLSVVSYEGTEIHQCNLCHGSLVHESDVQRIIIREEMGFSEQAQHMAELIRQEERLGKWKIIKRDPALLYQCPHCRYVKERMLRMFYTEVYKVEVDKCWGCGSLWFDALELETLQCLIEKNVQNSEEKF
jgi:heat shock protein HtpX